MDGEGGDSEDRAIGYTNTEGQTTMEVCESHSSRHNWQGTLIQTELKMDSPYGPYFAW